MKFSLIHIAALCFIISCKQSPSIDLEYLNGYWEIDRVIFSGGNEKKYNFNEYIEYFSIKDSIGFRTKLKPLLGSKYKNNNTKQHFKITAKNNNLKIQYSKNRNTWSEQLIEVSKTTIHIKNSSGDSYFYKPYTPIKL